MVSGINWPMQEISGLHEFPLSTFYSYMHLCIPEILKLEIRKGNESKTGRRVIPYRVF